MNTLDRIIFFGSLLLTAFFIGCAVFFRDWIFLIVASGAAYFTWLNRPIKRG